MAERMAPVEAQPPVLRAVHFKSLKRQVGEASQVLAGQEAILITRANQAAIIALAKMLVPEGTELDETAFGIGNIFVGSSAGEGDGRGIVAAHSPLIQAAVNDGVDADEVEDVELSAEQLATAGLEAGFAEEFTVRTFDVYKPAQFQASIEGRESDGVSVFEDADTLEAALLQAAHSVAHVGEEELPAEGPARQAHLAADFAHAQFELTGEL